MAIPHVPARLTPNVSPQTLSQQLRTAHNPLLARRRGVIGLSLAAIGAMVPITLYQTGILKRLPDPPLPYFDAAKVDASEEAYSYVATPDGAVAIANYAVTLALAAMGQANRETTQPLVALAYAAKVAFDTAFSVRLTIDQWTKHRAFCVYCLLGSAATLAMAPLALPEARAALRTLRRGEAR